MLQVSDDSTLQIFILSPKELILSLVERNTFSITHLHDYVMMTSSYLETSSGGSQRTYFELTCAELISERVDLTYQLLANSRGREREREKKKRVQVKESKERREEESKGVRKQDSKTV